MTDKQFEEVTEEAEEAARKHIFARISAKQVENLTVSVEAEGTKPINFSVEVNLVLINSAQNVDAETLAGEAVKAAFGAIEAYLRKLK